MAKTGDRIDPYQQFNFSVVIDNVASAGFSECSGLTTDTDPIDYREGEDKNLNVRKLMGLRKYTPIVLKRGYTQDKGLWDWRQRIIDGQRERHSGAISLHDELRKETLKWELRDAWISYLD